LISIISGNNLASQPTVDLETIELIVITDMNKGGPLDRYGKSVEEVGCRSSPDLGAVQEEQKAAADNVASEGSFHPNKLLRNN